MKTCQNAPETKLPGRPHAVVFRGVVVRVNAVRAPKTVLRSVTFAIAGTLQRAENCKPKDPSPAGRVSQNEAG